MSQADHQVYLSLGSNIDPEANIRQAVSLLRPHLNISALSSVWETPPVGTAGPNFLNMALAGSTPLTVQAVKEELLLPIEEQLGRRRTADKNSPRTIDLDIILYGDQLFEPRIWTLAFLAIPLAELIPKFRHPTRGETLEQAAKRMMAKTAVIRREDVFQQGEQG